MREAWRVLRPGGVYLFNVWDTMAKSPATRITHETVAEVFPSDPPQFYTLPHSLADTAPVSAWLNAAGFDDVAPIPVTTTGTSESAESAAIALVEGTPIVAAIVQRRADAVPEVRAAVARRVAAELGDRPVRNPMRAFVFAARKR